MRFVKRIAPLAAVAALCVTAPGCGGQALRWDRGPDSVALRNGDRLVWEFRHGRDLQAPMFHPVGLTDGTALTWDSPPDHTWHHALWFAWKYLNGVNYWETARDNQESYGVVEWNDVAVRTGRDFNAEVSLRLDYRPRGEDPVLTERREIRVSRPAADGSYHMDWTMTFTARTDVTIDRTPIIGEENGKAWGGYAGLSIRFAEALRDWQAVSSEGPVTWNTGQPFHAVKGPAGLDFSGMIDGRAAGIALLDHPENLNAPTPWYLVMNREKSFGFAQAAVVYYQPVRLAAGQAFQLRYRVVVHEGRWDAGRLQSAQSEFIKEVNSES